MTMCLLYLPHYVSGLNGNSWLKIESAPLPNVTEYRTINEQVKSLPKLYVGDTVCVENQTGSHPTRWDKTGIITEVQYNGQYMVRLTGSGRCTLRNRRFIRQCQHFCAEVPLTPWKAQEDFTNDAGDQSQADLRTRLHLLICNNRSILMRNQLRMTSVQLQTTIQHP